MWGVVIPASFGVSLQQVKLSAIDGGIAIRFDGKITKHRRVFL